MRRPLSIRTWIIGGIVALVLVPYIGTFLLVILTSAFEPPDNRPVPARDPAVLAELYHHVEGRPDRWADPAWQADLEARLAPLLLAVQLRAPDGRTVYRTTREFILQPVRHVVIYRGAEPAGEVSWHELAWSTPAEQLRFRETQDIIMKTGIAVLIVLTIWGAVTVASRAVLRPLGALSGAAEQINRGQLDFDVPTSEIRELNEFAQAFDQMRVGLKESIARQAAMEQERRLFVAAVAHDLRTPLTSIRGYLEGLRDGVARTPEKVERYVQVALEKAEVLERLIESFFAYSKTEYLNAPLQQEEVILGDLVRDAAEALRPRAEAKGVRLALDEGPEPCLLTGDRLMLSRVIDNLLDNAIRHTPAGGTVTAGWRGGVTQARLWVQDEGPGIPADALPHIFEPLYRADKARTARSGGAGLGLAIAKRLVEAHGGQIGAENREGARLTVTLPLGRGV